MKGKRVAETLMMDYHRQNHVEIKIVRIFNTYGPRMAINDGRVISNFIVQALRGEDLTVYGDGNPDSFFLLYFRFGRRDCADVRDGWFHRPRKSRESS